MSENNLHFVCTLDQAKDILRDHERFWVSNCGCREGKGQCARSRMDVCLTFQGETVPSGSAKREITRSEVDAILRIADSASLVPRPFRDYATHEHTEGICFCCDDCCDYFLNPGVTPCDRGTLVEATKLDDCTHCGACVDVCHFSARAMKDDRLEVVNANCYGCGLCVPACPTECIRTVPRQA
jgi:Pyruvate/2-oxoacid:ferredoxin oxidoreductase delta subunit